jgi:uncharacterized protein (DUF488 family)
MAGELVFTVGHSTHSAERFIELLRAADVTAVADVRSSPYSRFNPQFNKQDLKGALKRHEIAYAFVGQELGARSSDPKCYCDGRVVYSRLAQTALFKNGLKRIRKGAQSYRIALMCAEREPLECHRTLLVSRYLAKDGVETHGPDCASQRVQSTARVLRRLNGSSSNAVNAGARSFPT